MVRAVSVILVAFVLCLCSSCAAFDGTFSNTWAVKIRGGLVALKKLARKHGFVNESQVGRDIYFRHS